MNKHLLTVSTLLACFTLSGQLSASNSVVLEKNVVKQGSEKTSLTAVSVRQPELENRVAMQGSDSIVTPGDNVEVFAFGSGSSAEVSNVQSVQAKPVIGSEINKQLPVPLEPAPEAVADVYIDGPFKLYQSTGRVEFELHKGLLKPQVVQLLMHHQMIDSIDDIQWKTSENFMWPNRHTLSGESLDHVINALLMPYKLVAEFKGNGSVIIKKI